MYNEDLDKEIKEKRSVVIRVRPSRSEAEFRDILSNTKMLLTRDGYVGYNNQETTQRCLAHLLRKMKDLERMYGKTYPELKALKGELHGLFEEAKKVQRRSRYDPMVDTGHMEDMVYAIVSCIENLGIDDPFIGKLCNAVPDMFTFVNHPGMHPTNNESECALRRPVIFRKIRYGVHSERGARAFSNVMTCIQTWRARGLNVAEMLRKTLCGT